MKKTILVFGLMLQLMPIVHAAQTAKVIVENAAVLDKPQPDGTVVGTAAKNSSIAVSNVPTNGYFKSRIPSGVIGWISGNDILTVPPASSMPAAAATPVPVSTPAEVVTENTPPKRPEKKKNEVKENESTSDHSRIQISGGMQILNNGSFPAQIPTTGSKNGFGGTLEMQFKINELFYWAGRVEYFTSSSTQIISTTSNQTIKFHTIPLMVGAIFVPVSKSSFRLGVGVYGGLAAGTALTVTQVTTLSTGLSTGTVLYSSSDLTFYGNLQASVAVSSAFNLFAEGGYRIHNASYPLSTQLPADAFKANFGGIVTRLGIEFRL